MSTFRRNRSHIYEKRSYVLKTIQVCLCVVTAIDLYKIVLSSALLACERWSNFDLMLLNRACKCEPLGILMLGYSLAVICMYKCVPDGSSPYMKSFLLIWLSSPTGEINNTIGFFSLSMQK